MTEEIINFLNWIITNSEFQIGISTAIITSVASAIIGFSIFLIKRVLTKDDFENQQNIEHSMWILKKLHSFAELYYAPITRKLINAEDRLGKAIISKNGELIELAYTKISDLLKTYHDFEKVTGANILFIEKSKEPIAINKIRSLFLSLPFDVKDFHDIFDGNNSRTKISFKDWVNSDQCENSKKIVNQRLFELRSLFDRQTEKIVQHEDFLRARKKKWFDRFRKKEIMKDIDEFYVHEVHPKYVSKGNKTEIFGSGFNTKKLNFEVKMNNQNLQKNIMGDTVMEVTIPSTLSVGTYDLTVEGTINQKKIDEPMGLVIHVS